MNRVKITRKEFLLGIAGESHDEEIRYSFGRVYVWRNHDICYEVYYPYAITKENPVRWYSYSLSAGYHAIDQIEEADTYYKSKDNDDEDLHWILRT